MVDCRTEDYEDGKTQENLTLTEMLRNGTVLSADCSSRKVFNNMTSLWGVVCLIVLRDGTHRYSELRRKASGVSEKMLTQTLRRLEDDGFILRVEFPVVPPHVEYSLTSFGEEAAEHVSNLADWLQFNIGRIIQNR